MLKAILRSELLHAPVWAWLLAVNLAAALACVVALFIETKPMARPRHALLVAALVLLAGMAGIVIAVGYALLFWFEATMWRQRVTPVPARRIH
jgi:predicted outer membrane lipoprotein